MERFLAKIGDPSVSVLVAAYNEDPYIGDCLISLKCQSLRPLEIIVIDDGSTDKTIENCEKHGVKVLRQNHKGPGAARNLGALNATGRVLAIADADMTFDAKYLETLVSPILSGEAAATAGWDEYVSNWENAWARCQCWYSNLPDRRRLPMNPPDDSEVYRAVRRDFFLASGGFEEGRGKSDDASISLRSGVKARIVRDAICYHRNAGSLIEVFRDAVWEGRDVVARNGVGLMIIRRGIRDNPFRAVIKGILRGIGRREPFLPVYALVYSMGMYRGMLDAWRTKRYFK